MRREPSRLLLVWLWLMLWLPGCDRAPHQRKPNPKPVVSMDRTKPEARPVASAAKDCLEKFTIDQDNTYLTGTHRTHLRDWQKVIKAETIKDGVHIPATCTRDYQVGNMPMFYFSPGSKKMVVDVQHFSDLKVASGTSVKAGQRTVVGRVMRKALAGISPRKLARFLLQASVIHTYLHIKADLCLVKEEHEEGGPYRAHFQGVHLYFTNQRNEMPISFAVEITQKGELALLGSKS